MISVYSIFSAKNNRIYVGLSKDPLQRLREHNSGQTFSTKAYRPWRLFFIESGFHTLAQARKREKQLKSGFGKEYL